MPWCGAAPKPCPASQPKGAACYDDGFDPAGGTDMASSDNPWATARACFWPIFNNGRVCSVDGGGWNLCSQEKLPTVQLTAPELCDPSVEARRWGSEEPPRPPLVAPTRHAIFDRPCVGAVSQATGDKLCKASALGVQCTIKADVPSECKFVFNSAAEWADPANWAEGSEQKMDTCVVWRCGHWPCRASPRRVAWRRVVRRRRVAPEAASLWTFLSEGSLLLRGRTSPQVLREQLRRVGERAVQ